MTITSFRFLLFVAVGLVIYYLLPKSWQWIQLLIMSLFFYHYAARTYTIIYLIISTASAYVSTLWIDKLRKDGKRDSKLIPFLTAAALIINILIWFVFKGYEFWIPVVRRIASLSALSGIELIAALGMGYYTLQVLGYILDCSWETVEPQKNPLKLFLFVCFFPQLTTGPISRYCEMESLYQKHSFQYENITHGAQRILWGFFKKLVLAERVGIIVSGITSDLSIYNGCYSWIAILLYPIQLYADFSGCTDIVIGVAQMFDIRLAENFRSPFFSRSSQEIWQRWHITLGKWAKDYVLYPLLKSKKMIKFSKFTGKKLGKSMGKFIATSIGMFAVWMAIGIWHGAARFVVGESLWYWAVLMLGELTAPALRKVTDRLGIKTESFSWHLFQSGRTYIIYSIGITFFFAGLRKGTLLLKQAAEALIGKNFNPWIFFDGSILDFGVTWGDINIIILAVLLLLIVDILSEKYGYARTWMDKQGIVFRWGAWIGLFVIVLIYGKYGPGYNAASFIYQGF